MRLSLRGVVGIAATVSLATVALASGGQVAAERELLGVRILRDWKSVLQRHGQPTRIEMGASVGGGESAGGNAAAGSMGAMTGPMTGPMMGMGAMGSAPGGMGGGKMRGLPGMGGMTGPGGMAGLTGPGSMGSMMNMTGPGGMAAMGMGGAKGGKLGAMMGGAPGGGMMSGAMMGGDDTFAPRTGSMGGPGVGMAMGRGGASADTGDGEVTWVYERGPNTFNVLFNKDGRVIQVQSFGYKNGGVTARGVVLGDSVKRIYQTYGWPENSEKNPQTGALTLDYSRKSHVLFQLSDRDKKGMKLVGITVALTERGQP